MALADYRLCDVCGGKTFYDANMIYSDGSDESDAKRPPYRVAGKEQYDDPALNKRHGMRLGYVGDWAVICEDCAKTHRVIIEPLPESQ